MTATGATVVHRCPRHPQINISGDVLDDAVDTLSHVTRDPNISALIAAVDETLAGPAPQMLVLMASTLVDSVTPRSFPPPPVRADDSTPAEALAALIKTLLLDGSPQGAALARAVGDLVGDDAVADGTRRSLMSLDLSVPDWVGELHNSRIDGVLEIVDGATATRSLVIGVALSGSLHLSVVVNLDSGIPARLSDAYVLATSVAEIRDSWDAASRRDTRDGIESSWMEFPTLEEAHSTVGEALSSGALQFVTTDTWPACRPLVEWVFSLTTTGHDDGEGMTPLEYHSMLLAALSRSVGAHDIAEHVEVAPLPDEEFDFTPVPAAVHTITAEVLRLVDSCADALFDTQIRTACRRYLARVATADAGKIIGRASASSTAAAIVWNINRANHDLVSERKPSVSAKAITDYLGTSSSPTARAESIRRALGIYDEFYVNGLLSADYLTSATRLAVQKERDTHRAAIIELSLTAP